MGIIKKLRIKLRPIKPIVKGLIMVLIGLLLTRNEIGVGRLTTNIIFGLISYLFLALGGYFGLSILMMRNHAIKIKKTIELRSDLLFYITNIMGIVIVAVYVIFYYLDILVIITPAVIIAIWCLLGLHASRNREKSRLIIHLTSTLIFTMGLIFGASLNNILISLPVIFFFISITTLQLSREFVKGYINTKIMEGASNEEFYDSYFKNMELGMISKFCIILHVIASLFLVLPIFLGLSNLFLFLYLMIPAESLIIIATYLMVKVKNEKKDVRRIRMILKFAILLELLSFVVAAS